MEQLVIVRPDGAGRYLAQAVTVPEVKAAADTEAGAVEQVRQSLAAWLASAKLVRVDVPVSATGNPWLDSFGRSANDPQFADYREELQRARSVDETP
jgi:hypothetical protein